MFEFSPFFYSFKTRLQLKLLLIFVIYKIFKMKKSYITLPKQIKYINKKCIKE